MFTILSGYRPLSGEKAETRYRVRVGQTLLVSNSLPGRFSPLDRDAAQLSPLLREVLPISRMLNPFFPFLSRHHDDSYRFYAAIIELQSFYCEDTAERETARRISNNSSNPHLEKVAKLLSQPWPETPDQIGLFRKCVQSLDPQIEQPKLLLDSYPDCAWSIIARLLSSPQPTVRSSQEWKDLEQKTALLASRTFDSKKQRDTNPSHQADALFRNLSFCNQYFTNEQLLTWLANENITSLSSLTNALASRQLWKEMVEVADGFSSENQLTVFFSLLLESCEENHPNRFREISNTQELAFIQKIAKKKPAQVFTIIESRGRNFAGKEQWIKIVWPALQKFLSDEGALLGSSDDYEQRGIKELSRVIQIFSRNGKREEGEALKPFLKHPYYSVQQNGKLKFKVFPIRQAAKDALLHLGCEVPPVVFLKEKIR